MDPIIQNRNQLKLTIVGPGAMGCLLAAMLYKQDCPVSILDYKPDRAERLKKAGIQITSSKKAVWTAFPNITAEPGSLSPQDWVIVFVKAAQTADAVRRIGPMIGPETLIVSLQNGIGHESTLSKTVKPEQIALGVTSQGATLLNEGYVRHAGSGPTTLGLIIHNPEAKDRLLSLVTLLNNSGWPSQIVKDIYPHIWRKLIVNVGINALTALCGITNGKLPQHPESLRLQELAVAEAWTLSLKKDIALGLSLKEAHNMVNSVCRATAENRSSMLQDRIKNRPTEIDYINGSIAGMGKELGVATPVNEVLTLLVRLNSRLGWKNSKKH
ncbi:MAG: 2-dehydropantoate 2-reductase [Thermodesulfobacteriota bacterium]|nr:2-dehydropantoate 2-reductase [Thermodesulfobacteriota bacterium]